MCNVNSYILCDKLMKVLFMDLFQFRLIKCHGDGYSLWYSWHTWMSFQQLHCVLWKAAWFGARQDLHTDNHASFVCTKWTYLEVFPATPLRPPTGCMIWCAPEAPVPRRSWFLPIKSPTGCMIWCALGEPEHQHSCFICEYLVDIPRSLSSNTIASSDRLHDLMCARGICYQLSRIIFNTEWTYLEVFPVVPLRPPTGCMIWCAPEAPEHRHSWFLLITSPAI